MLNQNYYKKGEDSKKSLTYSINSSALRCDKELIIESGSGHSVCSNTLRLTSFVPCFAFVYFLADRLEMNCRFPRF